MVNVKDKWFGKCNICKREETLATVKVATGFGFNYTIIRSCDKCREAIRCVNEILLNALWRKV